MTTADKDGEVVHALVLKSMCLFPKNQKMPFYFSEMLFYFPEVSFYFPEVPFYLMLCLSRMLFLLGDCTFYLSCSELLKEIIFALLLKLYM